MNNSRLISCRRLAFFFLIFTTVNIHIQAQSSNTVGTKKPNIIYIYADDLGYGDLGIYGQTKIKTPNLDKMAREGMRFTQHYAGAPVCAPSRAMLMTGKHAGHSFVRGNYEFGGFDNQTEGGQMPLPEGTYTLPKMLQDAGYTTALIGKWGLGFRGTSGDPLRQGFDYYYGYLDQKQAHNHYPDHLWENGERVPLNNPPITVHRKLNPANATDEDFDYFKGKEYAADKMTEKAVAFIEKNKQKPFFLYLAFALPHASLQAPDAEVQKYIGQFDEKPYYGIPNYASTKHPLSTYAAMVSYIDEQTGIILRKLNQAGLSENTIVMFSSDNGASPEGGANPDFFRSVGNLRGLKRDLYEGGIRVPFIVRWQGKIKPGQTSDLISAQFDLMPTFAELVGQKTPIKLDGISILPSLFGNKQKQTKREYIYFEFPEKGGQTAIRYGKWKGVRSNIRKSPNALWEIYDLETDPGETKNRATEHPDLVKKFQEIEKKEHWTATIREWEFLNPIYSAKDQNTNQ